MMKKLTATDKELESMYWEQGLTCDEIAKIYDCSGGTVHDRFIRNGIPTRTIQEALQLSVKSGKILGKNHGNWKGGRIEQRGYIFIHKPYHPDANSNGYVREHRLVWEEHNGRVQDKYDIHHKNGNGLDNRIENLIALPKHKHNQVIPVLLKRISDLEDQLRSLTR